MDFSHHPYYSPVAASTNLAVHDLAWERALFLLTELCKGEPVSSLRSKFAPHPGITSDHVKIARYLLDKGLDADADYYNDGHVPLQLAARGHGDGSFAMVELLLDKGADINPRGKLPPLVLALRGFGQPERQYTCRYIIRRLVCAGARLDSRDIDIFFAEKDPQFKCLPYWSQRQKDYLSIKRLIYDMRAAGSLCAFRMMMRKQVLSLRTLVLRGRAAPRKGGQVWSPGKNVLRRDMTMEILIKSPNEIAWKILTYWRAEIYSACWEHPPRIPWF